MKLDIENEIRKYVEENAGTTENKIVEYLTQKRISSRKTTLRMITSLKDSKIIHDKKEAAFINCTSMTHPHLVELKRN